MKKLLAIVFLVNSYFTLIAQEKNVEWGELEGRSGQLLDVLPFHSKDFYTLRWKGGSMFGGYYLSRFDDLKETKSKRISISVNQNIANFEKVLIIDDIPAVVLTNVRDGKEQVFLQKYGYDLTPKDDAILLAEYDLVKGMSKEPIRIIQSNDKKYFAVLWLLIGKKKDRDVYGYAVYDNKYNKIDDGEYEVPFESRYSQITNHLLSNTGDYFFIVKEFTKNEDKRYGQADIIYKAMHIYQVRNDLGLEKYTMEVDGKRIEAVSVNTNDSTAYTITGVYGNNGFNGVSGVFFMQLDFKNQKILKQGFQEFHKDFITEDWTEKELRRAEKKIEKGKDEPALYNYQMREAQFLPDGSVIGVMEQSYVVVRSFSDTRSMITFSYTYYYNDIVVFKIGDSGNFDWIEKVRKNQVSTNDGGPLSSFASIVDKGKLRLFFNDNINNYDQSGKYILNSAYAARFNLKHNVVATTEIDLASGLQSRYTLFRGKETKTLAYPKLFKVDVNSKEMLFYTSYKGRELYGIMKFE
jgi:hypothetical protein